MPATSFMDFIFRARPLTRKEGLGILDRDRYRCQYCGLDGMSSFENSLVMTVDVIIKEG